MKRLQILGMGCAKCNKLQALTEQAAQQLGIEYSIEKVSSLEEIQKFRVMMTPALAVDGVVKVSGRVPDIDELLKLIG